MPYALGLSDSYIENRANAQTTSFTKNTPTPL